MSERGAGGGRPFGGPAAKGWFYTWRRRLFRMAIWQFLYRFWMRMHIEGWENIPAEGPVIMMGNHMSNVDPVIMISFYPDRDIVPLSKIEAFSLPVIRYFVAHWGAIPVRRGSGGASALKSAIRHINDGDIVMFYAEGTRSKTGMIKGQMGSAYLALKTDAVIVPVAIWGTRKFPGTWIKEFKRTDIYIRFGTPFCFKSTGRRIDRDALQPMTDEAMYKIAELLPEEWRGVYGDFSQATTDYLDFDVSWQPATRDIPRRVQFRERLTT